MSKIKTWWKQSAVRDWFDYIVNEIPPPSDRDHCGLDGLILFGPEAIPVNTNLKATTRKTYAGRMKGKS